MKKNVCGEAVVGDEMDRYNSLKLNGRHLLCWKKLGCREELLCYAHPLGGIPCTHAVLPAKSQHRHPEGTRGAKGDLLSILCPFAFIVYHLEKGTAKRLLLLL